VAVEHHEGVSHEQVRAILQQHGGRSYGA
jgi:hypothetical protein